MGDKALKIREKKREFFWLVVSIVVFVWWIWSWYEVTVVHEWSKANSFRIICAICDYIHG